MIPELLSVKGKAMTKPVPLNEYDVKCALLKVLETERTLSRKYSLRIFRPSERAARLWEIRDLLDDQIPTKFRVKGAKAVE